LHDPPKFTKIGIFGLKTNHLATLSPLPFVSTPIFFPPPLMDTFIDKCHGVFTQGVTLAVMCKDYLLLQNFFLFF
jgi:hypothetical protein